MSKSGNKTNLNDCWVIWKSTFESRLRFWRLADANIFDVRTSENDILINLISWGHGAIGGTILSSKWSYWKINWTVSSNSGNSICLKCTFRQSYGWIFGVDSVQNSLVSDLRLGDQGNFRAQIGHSTRWTHVWIRLGKDGKDIRRCSTASGAEMNEISDQMTDTNKLRDSEAWGSILRRYSEFHFFGRLKTSLKFSKAHLKSNIILI